MPAQRLITLVPFRNFIVANEAPLRQIAINSTAMRWVLPYIDFIMRSVGRDLRQRSTTIDQNNCGCLGWRIIDEEDLSRKNLFSRIKPDNPPDRFGGVPISALVRAVWRCGVGELLNGSCNPAPGIGTVVIAVCRQLVDTGAALLERFVAVAFQHQGGGTPDIDLRYHAGKIRALAVDKRLTPIIAWLA